ncbi:hypothetical protein B0J13DRAFT_555464 [Dactylonectria estremocensis]|uniref:YMC020W-like alpha/beta hydrolase domain-containing protein n=1 Tax=Dactylonectria estremocensis TaxID=1079267 RepID=A0A9P9J1E9_9HYPO|nr:hypothetical protein B0J13DRAFT_555464 [Dactylonectria estremocensis]
MSPRKRVRPNPATTTPKTMANPVATTESATSLSQAPATSEPSPKNQQMPPSRQANESSPALAGQGKHHEIRKAKSWYGSWPKPPKATASTSVARENILGGTVKSTKAPDLSRFESKKADDASSLHSMNGSGSVRGLPKISEVKPDEANAADDTADAPGQQPEPEIPSCETSKATDDIPKSDPEATPTIATPTRPTTSSGWLGWLSRAPVGEIQASIAPAGPEMMEINRTKEIEPPRPVTPPAQTEPPPPDISPQVAKSAPASSWFGFWHTSTEQTNNAGQKPDVSAEPAPEPVPEAATEPASEDVAMTDAPPVPHKHTPAPQAGSTWAFWSKDSPKTKGQTAQAESGEMAVFGDGSEAQPTPMEECDVPQTPSKAQKGGSKPKDIQATGRSTWRRNKRLRPQSMEIDSTSTSPSGASTPTSTAPQLQDPQQPTIPPARVDSSNQSIADSESSAKATNNLLLPSFSSTYQMKENPSILKQITQFLLRTQQSSANHVVRVKDPPKIQKAIAIGVHGLFPATYLRPMMGQPTGTSLRFANLCAESIRRWAEDHGCGDCEIEKVALEGEGKIKDRVENLWKLMLNWIDHIRSADLVVIACHSQGVPVSIMLLEKLIDLGIITNAKIGVCAMAGVSMGPFPDIKSSLLMGSAAELWDFGNPESDNSKRFEASLKHVLDHGARITFIGSIDDQLVPMESAVYSPANHPYIYRAVFIDGRVHAPDFIAHLVGFALKLRNLGVSDHGLIRELSIPLAGSLYSGAGHSRIYFDDAVYDLAISHALETTPANSPAPCDITTRQGPLTSPNPYVLPWIMRGLLEENFVRTELHSEASELLRQFDDWKPTNKALKDVKYRLEALRSKL